MNLQNEDSLSFAAKIFESSWIVHGVEPNLPTTEVMFSLEYRPAQIYHIAAWRGSGARNYGSSTLTRCATFVCFDKTNTAKRLVVQAA